MNITPADAQSSFAKDPVVTVSAADIVKLKHAAAHSTRHRARLCAHPDTHNPLHEMVIVIGKNAYVRPHMHINKSESFHIIEGRLDVVLFEDDGAIQRVIHMGDYASGLCFYYRLAEARYHTLIIRTDPIIFHETTNGPFDPAQTAFAPWAPAESDPDKCAQYLARIAGQAASK